MHRPPLTTISTLLALTAVSLPAQKAPVPPPDPQLPARLKELKGYVKNRKMTQDFQAIGLIQNLCKDVDRKNPKDKAKLAKALGDVFKTGKVRTGNHDVLYREAAEGLGKLGEDGAKQLAKAVENKRLADNVALRAHLLRQLGKTEDPKQIKYLLEVTTRSHIDELRAAAGEALGNFTGAKLKAKREIVKEIIRAWGSLHSRATQAANLDPNGPVDFGPQNARRILRAVEGKWVSTLQKLTGVSHSRFQDWQRWQNKNKNWQPPS